MRLEHPGLDPHYHWSLLHTPVNEEAIHGNILKKKASSNARVYGPRTTHNKCILPTFKLVYFKAMKLSRLVSFKISLHEMYNNYTMLFPAIEQAPIYTLQRSIIRLQESEVPNRASMYTVPTQSD